LFHKEKTYNALVKVINGEEIDGLRGRLLPYQGGRDLVKFFNELESNDIYDSSFGSRGDYTDVKLRQLNSVQEFSNLINSLLSPIYKLEHDYDYKAVLDYLNPYLQFEDLEIYSFKGKHGTEYAVRLLSVNQVEFNPKEKMHHPLSHEYITEQVEKCDAKMSQFDYAGAITNARTLVEEVLKAIQTNLDSSPKETGGDLLKLYKEIQKLLNLDPASQPSDALKQILSGFISIVNGLSTLRNNSSDGHARTFNPKPHHAKLAVNAAKTLGDFLFEKYEHQKKTEKFQCSLSSD
jgi:hypothetical protein